MSELATAAAVRAAGATGEVRRYTAELDGQWAVGSKLNGGYLLAVLANAAVDAAGPGHPHPVAVTAPGPLQVRQWARLVGADRVDEECDVWDSTGALVASAFQLAAVRLPEIP